MIIPTAANLVETLALMENLKKNTEQSAEEVTKLESEEEIEMLKDMEFHSSSANLELVWTLKPALSKFLK
jgi:hypothetical protein